jgi:uncharacterized membrane protein YgcG
MVNRVIYASTPTVCFIPCGMKYVGWVCDCSAELIRTGDLGVYFSRYALIKYCLFGRLVKLLRSRSSAYGGTLEKSLLLLIDRIKKWHSVRYHTVLVRLRLTHSLLCSVTGASGGRGGFGGRGGGRGGRGGVGDRGGRGGARGGRT